MIGLVLAAVGVVGITYGLSESEAAGSLTSGRVLIPVLVGIVLLVAFRARSRRVERPCSTSACSATAPTRAASIVTFCLGAALFGAMILMPLYFQEVLGDSALKTGLLLIPQGIGGGIGMFLSGRATERLGAGRTALFGGLMMAAATIPFVLVTATTPYTLLGVAMIVRGVGMGLSMMPSMTAAFSVLTKEQVNDASPQLTVLQRVGGSLGTAVIAVVLQNNLSHIAPGPHAVAAAATGFGHTYWWVMGATLIALVPTALLARIERRAPRARRWRPRPSPRPSRSASASGDRMSTAEQRHRPSASPRRAAGRDGADVRGRATAAQPRELPGGLTHAHIRSLHALFRRADDRGAARAQRRAQPGERDRDARPPREGGDRRAHALHDRPPGVQRRAHRVRAQAARGQDGALAGALGRAARRLQRGGARAAGRIARDIAEMLDAITVERQRAAERPA